MNKWYGELKNGMKIRCTVDIEKDGCPTMPAGSVGTVWHMEPAAHMYTVSFLEQPEGSDYLYEVPIEHTVRYEEALPSPLYGVGGGTEESMVLLERMRWGSRRALSQKWAERVFGTLESIDVWADEMFDQIVCQIKGSVAGEWLLREEVRYPTDWKEALKERFAPKWFIARWPIRYTVHKYEARALYPKISMPGREVFPVTGMTKKTEVDPGEDA